jgi:hypothetical protein
MMKPLLIVIFLFFLTILVLLVWPEEEPQQIRPENVEAPTTQPTKPIKITTITNLESLCTPTSQPSYAKPMKHKLKPKIVDADLHGLPKEYTEEWD